MTGITTRRQSINFLGFLRGQLSGLHGIPTLCYELIQNADDVKDTNGNPGASKIVFDLCDDALYVYNDGVFREIDFRRMEQISWGNKREEEGTIGAFGLGFISVYQITDSPELFSSGRHWQFVPNGKEDERIIETLMETKETKFRLPWAFEESAVRLELGIQPVERDRLNYYEHQIEKSIESAALFLKQIKILELRRNGHTVRKIETLREQDVLILSDGKKDIIWRIFTGRFDSGEKFLREMYGSVIENKRTSKVRIAVPDTPEIEGLLYAFLPSENVTGMPFHINADFYPTSDRKRIIFDEGYKQEWNEAAIQCAAEILAAHCDDILGIFSNQDFWEFADRVEKASERRGLTDKVSLFWEKMKPEIASRETVLTSLNTIVTPKEAIFLDTRELASAEKIFADLGINCVHPDLRSKQNILKETGVRNLKISDVYEAFNTNGWNERMKTSNFPASLQNQEGWELFWEALNQLWERAAQYVRHQIKNDLGTIAIAFGSDGALWPPDQLFQSDQDTIDFFSKFSSIAWYEEKNEQDRLPSQLVPRFKIQDGIGLLENAEYNLQQLYEENVFEPLEMLEWFEKYRHEMDQSQKQTIKELSIWPTGEKQLQPLSDLFLAGDFEDPFQLAQFVNLNELGGKRDFLQQHLGVQKLNFYTYVKDWIPDIVRNQKLKSEDLQKLIRILADHRSNLVDDRNLQVVLSQLPIVWCGKDEFYPASEVWFDTHEVRELLGEEIHIAKLPLEKQEAAIDLYKWLGVLSEPSPEDVTKRIRELAYNPPNDRNRQLVTRLIKYVASKWVAWKEVEKQKLTELRNLSWLPGTKDNSKWVGPQDVYSIYSKHLFESVGNFLNIEYSIQRNSSDFFQFLGIKSEPTPEQVVQHLIWSSENAHPITNQIYEFLSRKNYVDDPVINRLANEKCLYLKDSSEQAAYYFTNQVFWEQHPFGDYRFSLPLEFGPYKALLEKIDVKSSPDVYDALDVLLEISERFSPSNNPLPKETEEENIFFICWKMIGEALDNEKISANEIKSKLGGVKIIPDSRNILVKPELMFFEDRPGWGRKFQILKNNLTSRIEGAWRAMEAAGVRPLSEVITTELVNLGDSIEDATMVELIQTRQNLLRRVVETHRSRGNKRLNIECLNNLSFYRADPIQIVRVFSGFNQQERSQLESVGAILHDNVLYFSSKNGSLPWPGISRELSYVINPTGEIHSLGMELNTILSQPIEEATVTLDGYGYPHIEIKESEIPDGVTLGAADEGEVDIPESLRIDITPHNGLELGPSYSSAPIPNKVQASGDSFAGSERLPSSKRVNPPKPKKRRTSRLVSYVYPEDAFSTRQEDRSFAEKRTRLGKTGVQKVIDFEIEQGRSPKDMEEIQVNHPGYDIKSTCQDGSIRYIEVKSFSGIWDGQNPAQMTKNEFLTAKKKGDKFWLYIVERADSEDFQIYQIHNPANRVDYFLFDHGWMINESE